LFAYSSKIKRLPLPDEAVSLVEGDRADTGVAPEWAGGTLTPLPLCECRFKECTAESLAAQAWCGGHAAKLGAPHPAVGGDFIKRDARHKEATQPHTPVHAEPLFISGEERALKWPSTTKHFASKGEDLFDRCASNLREAHLGTVPRRTRLSRGLPFLHA
jgi:hypothetical protein